MQCSVEIGIKIKIETSFKLCSNTTLLISGATAGLVYARNGPLQQVLDLDALQSLSLPVAAVRTFLGV